MISEWNALVAKINPLVIGPVNVGMSDEDTNALHNLVSNTLLQPLENLQAIAGEAGKARLLTGGYAILSDDIAKNILLQVRAKYYKAVPYAEGRRAAPGMMEAPYETQSEPSPSADVSGEFEGFSEPFYSRANTEIGEDEDPGGGFSLFEPGEYERQLVPAQPHQWRTSVPQSEFLKRAKVRSKYETFLNALIKKKRKDNVREAAILERLKRNMIYNWGYLAMKANKRQNEETKRRVMESQAQLVEAVAMMAVRELDSEFPVISQAAEDLLAVTPPQVRRQLIADAPIDYPSSAETLRPEASPAQASSARASSARASPEQPWGDISPIQPLSAAEAPAAQKSSENPTKSRLSRFGQSVLDLFTGRNIIKGSPSIPFGSPFQQQKRAQGGPAPKSPFARLPEGTLTAPPPMASGPNPFQQRKSGREPKPNPKYSPSEQLKAEKRAKNIELGQKKLDKKKNQQPPTGPAGRGRWTDYSGPVVFNQKPMRGSGIDAPYRDTPQGNTSNRSLRTKADPLDFKDDENDPNELGDVAIRDEMIGGEMREAHLDPDWKGLPKRWGIERRIPKLRKGYINPKEKY